MKQRSLNGSSVRTGYAETARQSMATGVDSKVMYGGWSLPANRQIARILTWLLAGLILCAMLGAGLITIAGHGRVSISLATPQDGSVNVARDAPIKAQIRFPLINPGLDLRSVKFSNIRIYPAGRPSELIDAEFLFDDASRVIQLVPKMLLGANTPYVFEVLGDGITDRSGRAVAYYRGSFRTGSHPTGTLPGVTFTKERVTGTDGQHTTLTIGPDGKLYAAGINGVIRRWAINDDGTLSDIEIIPTIWMKEGVKRLLIGFAFDPSATAENLIAWVSHSTHGYKNMPDWGGKITRLSGPNLDQAEDYVVHLPRSTRDHATNSMAFGPDGALYVSQGGNTSLGDADEDWGFRPERLLSAAVLRVDVNALASSKLFPLDVKTEEGGSYDPMAPDAPVKIFASGVRNSYDFVWHSNGFMYAPNNGAAKGGRTPESVPGTMRPDGRPYVGPSVPSISDILVEDDFLYRVPPIAEDGSIHYRYYGHPNPRRGEYVMDGGNPTADMDVGEVDLYPVGVMPDEAWEGHVYSFGSHVSPTGVIEYRGDAFDGALKGSLLVALYGGRGRGNIIVLRLDSTGGIARSDDVLGIPGFMGFGNPLDLVENPRTGFIYVSQMGDGGGIVLLRPVEQL